MISQKAYQRAYYVARHGTKRKEISDEDIRRLYVDEVKSLREAALVLGVTSDCVRIRLKKMGVPRRARGGPNFKGRGHLDTSPALE